MTNPTRTPQAEAVAIALVALDEAFRAALERAERAEAYAAEARELLEILLNPPADEWYEVNPDAAVEKEIEHRVARLSALTQRTEERE